MNRLLYLFLVLFLCAPAFAQVEVSCPGGQSPLPALTTRSAVTGNVRYNACYDRNGIVNIQGTVLGGIPDAQSFPGSDAGAQINACLLSLTQGGICDARSYKGTVTVTTNPFAGLTAGIPLMLLLGDATFNTSVTWQPNVADTAITIQGVEWLAVGGSRIRWTGVAAGTLLDTSASGAFALRHVYLDGASSAATAWKGGGGAGPRFFNRMDEVYAVNFTGTVFDMGTTSANGVCDSRFEFVKIQGGTVGIQASCQDLYFYFSDIQGASQTGVKIKGNTKVSWFGGHFATNAYDVMIDGDSSGAEFNSVWFEDSVNGIINVPAAHTLLSPLNFNGCNLGTASAVSLMDFTNLTGVVSLVGNVVRAGGSNQIIFPATLSNVHRIGNSGTVTWTGDAVFATYYGGFINSVKGTSNSFRVLSDATGGANPNKWERVNAGCYEMLNNAQTVTIFQVCDGGVTAVRTLQSNVGVAANGAGIKHGRTAVTNCATTGCEVTVTWGTAFADANYTPVCTILDATAQSEATGLRLGHIRTQAAASIVVTFDNFSGATVSGTLNCIAFHD